MPLYQEKNISDYQKLGIWKLSETKEELLTLIANIKFNTTELSNLKHENRIKQWIATRLLLHNFMPDAEIIYDNLGKPSLSNGFNISISHTNNFVAILINEKGNCGIDIEKIDAKVERVKHKFLGKTDLNNISSIQDLTIYWSAKEALYKYYGKKEVLFIENLFIKDFNSNLNNFKGVIKMQSLATELDMNWQQIEDNILVYTL